MLQTILWGKLSQDTIKKQTYVYIIPIGKVT